MKNNEEVFRKFSMHLMLLCRLFVHRSLARGVE